VALAVILAMSASAAPAVRPFCPNANCPFHAGPTGSWRWVRNGSFRIRATPGRIQRYQCRHCRRHFSEQTFRASYWLKCPELLLTGSQRLVGCSGFRQIARELDVSPQTVLGLSARIVLPERWARYYWRHTPTRRLPRVRTHTLRYAA
jgi:transposase-like protein